MPQSIDYVRTLAEEIGPRPATTDAEHRAAEWLRRTFVARGLETEVQTFEAPRTYAWAYVVYNMLTLVSAFASGYRPYLAWPAFAVSAIVAFFFWSDLDTRFGLTRLMPKGPSQNVIARHVPRARRGERLRRIVIVAHYDSARASLAFAPGLVRNFATTLGLMKAATFLTPLFVLAIALPWTAPVKPWLWYVTMAVAAYLVIPVLINVHREIAMDYVAGANDNASGVAAMLGVMERIVPAPDASRMSTIGFDRLRRTASAAVEAGVVPEGAELSYTPGSGVPVEELPDDFAWAEPIAEWSASSEAPPQTLVADVAGSAPDEMTPPSGRRAVGARGLLESLRLRRTDREEAAPKEWLGVDDDFDARKAGKRIGSWDRFEEDDDDDGLGWKGGWAGDDPIGDSEFAASEAARIRRRVTESVDRELTEKEVWFVATGAEEVGTWGMQAFLAEYGPDLRDALIINIDGCGAGQLFWASAEGMARRYRANPRLVGLARRVSRDTETLIKPRVYKGLSTDATPALARGYKALSIMAFDSAGVPVNWHWRTDTVEAIEADLIERTAEFICAMVREA